jgi:hypothetical protein
MHVEKWPVVHDLNRRQRESGVNRKWHCCCRGRSIETLVALQLKVVIAVCRQSKSMPDTHCS